MAALAQDHESGSLAERVARRVQQATSGRISDLAVEEVHGEVVVRGRTRTHHVLKLALQGALEVLAARRVRPIITVG